MKSRRPNRVMFFAASSAAAILAANAAHAAQAADPGQTPAQRAAQAAPPQDNATPVGASQASGGSPATGTQANAGASPGQGVTDTGAPVATGQATTLGEVVVTAERTQTNVQKTPISLAVVSGQQVVSRGVTNLQNITNVVPDVKISTGQFNAASASIRGVSSNGGNGAAVTINFDGQYITGFNGLLYDISRVEVLKGPQGTLYGLNSTAGALNIITNPPVLGVYSANGSVEFGNYSSIVAQGAVNLPINDTLAVRLSATRNSHDGYRDHPGQDSSDYADFTSGRIGVLWQPVQQLKVRVTAEYTDTDFGDTSLQGVVLSPSATLPAGQPPTNYSPAGLNPREWTLDFPGYNQGYQDLIRGDVEYDFGWAKLTYLGSFIHTKRKLFQDAFGTPTQTVDYQQNSATNVTQQELRLNGVLPTRTKWQVGYFYLETINPNFTNIYNGLTRFSPIRTVPFLHFDDPANQNKNNAVYGQATQTITDQLSVTGGLRYTQSLQYRPGYSQDQINVGAYLGSNGNVIQYSHAAFPGRNYYDNITWHVGVDYQWTPRNLLYLSIGTSFKDGGFTQINSYLPEEITAYELGSKNRFLDGKLEANAAVYYYDYSNQQVSAFLNDPRTGVAAATTLNAGSSTLKGGELNITWLPLPTDRLTLAVSYTDAKFGQFSAAQNVIPQGSTTAIPATLDGNTPPNAPDWSLAAGWEHHWDLAAGQIVATGNLRYSSGYYLDIYNLPAAHVDAYHQTDLSVGYHAPNDRWEVTAFVRNLEDNDTLNVANYVVQGVGVYEFGWAPPRTFGVRIGAHW